MGRRGMIGLRSSLVVAAALAQGVGGVGEAVDGSDVASQARDEPDPRRIYDRPGGEAHATR